MIIKKKILMLLVCGSFLAGCAGTSFNWDQARGVKQGMTESQLVEKMGKPYMVTAQSDRQIWAYSHANAFTGANSVSFILKDGYVVGVPTVPESFK